MHGHSILISGCGIPFFLACSAYEFSTGKNVRKGFHTCMRPVSVFGQLNNLVPDACIWLGPPCVNLWFP